MTELMQTIKNTVPNPDPTSATIAAIQNASDNHREIVEAQLKSIDIRIDAMDEAAKVLSTTINRTPTDIQKEITHVTEIMNEKFKSVATQFAERDTRSERESRDNKVAVDAAFAAQKEAAAKQDEANAKAIDKSEKATTETIKTNQELSRSTTDSLSKSLDEVKERLGKVENINIGRTEQKHDTRDNISTGYAIGGIIMFIITIISAGVAIFKP